MGTRGNRHDGDKPPQRRSPTRPISNGTLILVAAAVLVPAALLSAIIIVRAVNNRQVTNPINGEVIQPGQLNPAAIVNPRAAADVWNLREFRDYVRKNGFTDPAYTNGDLMYYTNEANPTTVSQAVEFKINQLLLTDTDGVRVKLCSNPKSAHDLAGSSEYLCFDYSRFVIESKCREKMVVISRALGVNENEISGPSDAQKNANEKRRDLDDALDGLGGKLNGGKK